MSLWGYFKTKVCSNEIKDFNSAVDDYADCREEVFDLTLDLNETKKLNENLVGKIQDLKDVIDTLSQTLIDEKQNKLFKNDLPSCFEETTENYKGNCTIISKLEEKEWSYKKASDCMELTPLWDDYLTACKIKETDSALQVFNKILATEQRLVKYVLDYKQWGKGESWQRAAIEWMTKKSDCENNAARVVSVFEYYQLKFGRFADAFAFVGTGYFNRTYGHAFPCLLINTDLAWNDYAYLIANMYIGEATLDAEIPARELILVKEQYDISWGAFSFWHNFKLKEELKWW